VDANGDGQIDFEEFKAMMIKISENPNVKNQSAIAKKGRSRLDDAHTEI